MKNLFGFLFLFLANQNGNIRFGFQRNILMDENGEGGTGGGGAGGEGGTGGDDSDDDKSGGKGGKGSGTGGKNIDELPEWAKNEISSLRKESAKHRTTNKELSTKLSTFETALKKAGLMEDETPPEQKLQQVTSQAEKLAVHNALLELAVDHGVSKENFKYFQFLMNEKLEELAEDEELSEEQLNEVLEAVKAGSNKGTGNTSFGGGKGKGKDDGGNSGVTLEEFTKMGIMAKSALYQKDAATYQRLVGEAKAKGLM